MSLLKQVIQESIELSEEFRSRGSSRTKIRPDEGRQAIFDAIKLVGPHMAKQAYEAMRTIDPEELKGTYGKRIHSYRFSMNDRKRIVQNARTALAKAIILLGDKADQMISHELDQYLNSRIDSDIRHQKSRMDQPWESGEMQFKS